MNSLSTFINEIYEFLQTVTIHNPYILAYHKKRIKDVTGIDDIPDIENPYYINMMGNYYTNLSYPELDDSPIRVRLLDNPSSFSDSEKIILEYYDSEIPETLEFPQDNTILFSKTTLAIATKTASSYRFDSTKLSNLVLKYPNQSALIKNILFPVDIFNGEIGSFLQYKDVENVYDTTKTTKILVRDPNEYVDSNTQAYITALNSKRLMFDKDPYSRTYGKLLNYSDFSLLGYSVEHLEENEVQSIIDAISSFLQVYSTRWNVPEYIEFEKYASMMYWTILWTLLPMVIFKQRISNLHTSAVHSDLLWEYLISNGLENYRDILTREQQLFLYKNIRYLLNSKGTIKTLKILADKLLTPYNLTLTSKHVAHNTLNARTTCIPTPVVLTTKIDNNAINDYDIVKQYAPLNAIYKQEIDNKLEPDVGPDLLPEQTYKISNSPASRLPTKLLEFARGNIDMDIGIKFVRYAIESLIYLSTLTDENNAPVLNYTVSLTSTSSNNIDISIEDAIFLLIYLMYSEDAPTVVLTNDNINIFVDLQREVIVDKERVLITNSNKHLYIGLTATIPGPVRVPSRFILSRPYRINTLLKDEELASIIETSGINFVKYIQDKIAITLSSDNASQYYTGKFISTEVLYDNKRYIITNENHTWFTNKTVYIVELDKEKRNFAPPVFTTTTSTNQSLELLEYIEHSFGIKNNDVDTLKASNDLIWHRSYDMLYDKLLVSGALHINTMRIKGLPEDVGMFYITSKDTYNNIDYLHGVSIDNTKEILFDGTKWKITGCNILDYINTTGTTSREPPETGWKLNNNSVNAIHVYTNIKVEDETTYTTDVDSGWFYYRPELYNIVKELDASDNRKLIYSSLIDKLIASILPVLSSSYVKIGSLSTIEHELMRQLFVQLCSYDVVFLNTDINLIAYEKLSPIVCGVKPYEYVNVTIASFILVSPNGEINKIIDENNAITPQPIYNLPVFEESNDPAITTTNWIVRTSMLYDESNLYADPGMADTVLDDIVSRRSVLPDNMLNGMVGTDFTLPDELVDVSDEDAVVANVISDILDNTAILPSNTSDIVETDTLSNDTSDIIKI